MARETRGRPRSRTWMGALGSFVDNYTAVRLAHDIDADHAEVYCWIHGDRTLSIRRAIQISEIAKVAGVDLSLETIYEAEVTRVRRQMRSSLPPL